MKQPISDVIMSWAVCLIPKFICLILWKLSNSNYFPFFPFLGRLAPHILGRLLGVDAKRIE
jgi:hypothetical protein